MKCVLTSGSKLYQFEVSNTIKTSLEGLRDIKTLSHKEGIKHFQQEELKFIIIN